MRIAMLLHKSVEHDSRVRREARALAADGHRVVVLHLPREREERDVLFDGFKVRSVTPPAWVRDRLPKVVYRLVFLLSFVGALCRLRPDAVHAHDAAMLAPAWAGAWLTGAALVYDSHEFAVGVPYRQRAWGWGVAALERLAIGRCAAVVTVSDGIAARLQERYGLPGRPTVVRNLPDPAECELDYEAPDLRDALGMDPTAPLVLHLGAVALDRGCETLVQAMALLPKAHLLFLGSDDSAYAAGLEELSRRVGVADRVHFRASVPVGQIRAHTLQATVGVSLLEDTCENHRLALPNKIFEYLAAEVPVVVSDLPELRALIEAHGVGEVVDPEQAADLGGGLLRAIENSGNGSGSTAGSTPARRIPAWADDAVALRRLYAGLSAPA